MGRISSHLGSATDLQLVALVVICGVLVVCTPRRWRLEVAVAFTCAWLAIGSIRGLGTISDVAKITVPLGPAMCVFASIFRKRRSLRPTLALHPILAIFALMAGVSALDYVFAGVIQGNWLVATVAGVQVARCVYDETDLIRILRAVAVGTSIGIVITLAAIWIDPLEGFGAGTGRLYAFLANPNSMAALVVVAGPILAYLTTSSSSRAGRLLAGAMFGASLVSVVVLVSKTATIVLGFALLPFLRLRRGRALYVPLLFGMPLLVLTGPLARLTQSLALDRILDLSDPTRDRLFHIYVAEGLKRPVAGLLFTTGSVYQGIQNIGLDAHNAYAHLFYIGGGILIGGIFLAMLLSLWRWLTWYRVSQSFLVLVLGFHLVSIYASAWTSRIAFYPTHPMGFYHLLLVSVIFLGPTMSSRSATPLAPPPEEPLQRAVWAPSGARVTDAEIERVPRSVTPLVDSDWPAAAYRR